MCNNRFDQRSLGVYNIYVSRTVFLTLAFESTFSRLVYKENKEYRMEFLVLVGEGCVQLAKGSAPLDGFT